ncbi:Protein SYM1 [Tolypocladium ophioglossoides CBS 100239]|uniref:Protein SYM1 n=1 Tax=Tolypocladium ophioglossoides (strain CBS 100239) TaxID=1163406 RepID=A0A0L0MY08_TOLOC|nr:Protein SYM1 [Tolypocladium ophioglossoides CBS 100239]
MSALFVRAAALRSPLRAALRPRLHQLRPRSSKASKPPAAKADAVSGGAATPGAAPGPGPVPFWQRLGPVTRAVEAYGRSQRARPYATQVVGAFFIYLCADLGAQRIGGREYDAARTGRTLFIGLAAAIPYYRWFVFLSRNFNYTSRVRSIATKVAMNQLCFTPTFNTYFFGAQALLAGDGLAATAERVRDTVPTSWLNSFKVWPAVVVFSFTFLPMEYRSIFSGFIAVGWQTYLSYLNKQAELREQARMLAATSTIAVAGRGSQTAAVAP